MKKKFLLYGAVLLLLVGIWGGVFAKQAKASGVDADVRESVAVVSTCFELTKGGEVTLGWGTCFFVGKPKGDVEYLITNHHVISDFLKRGGGEETDELIQDGVTVKGKWKIRVYFDSEDYEEAYVVDYDDKKDIALLKLETATDKRKAMKLCSPANDMVGSNVYGVGYPGLSDNAFADSTTTWGMNDASITSGTIGRLITTSGTGVKRIQTDAVIQHGNSGGPLVNQKGSALGINVAYVNSTDRETLSSETTYYAVNIDEVIPMLRLHDVEYVMEGKGADVLTIVLIVAAVLILAGIVAVIVVLAVRKKSNPAPKGSQPVPVAEAVQAPPQPQIMKRAYVRSLAVQHNGARFLLDGGQILVGRDASVCTIVFRQDTPGISGRHCSLRYDPAAGDFLLTDLNSTYGTFLANGEKLAPDTPYRLKAGESFYLGDKVNRMCVEVE